jgi:hypothetical protein
MNWVQWVGAGTLVVVTTIFVVDAAAWLILRIQRSREAAESQGATISSCLHQDTINAARSRA